MRGSIATDADLGKQRQQNTTPYSTKLQGKKSATAWPSSLGGPQICIVTLVCLANPFRGLAYSCDSPSHQTMMSNVIKHIGFGGLSLLVLPWAMSHTPRPSMPPQGGIDGAPGTQECQAPISSSAPALAPASVVAFCLFFSNANHTPCERAELATAAACHRGSAPPPQHTHTHTSDSCISGKCQVQKNWTVDATFFFGPIWCTLAHRVEFGI